MIPPTLRVRPTSSRRNWVAGYRDRVTVRVRGLAKRKEKPPLMEDAPSIHVPEKVRLPPTKTDAVLETGCDRKMLASRRLERGTLAIVAAVTP